MLTQYVVELLLIFVFIISFYFVFLDHFIKLLFFSMLLRLFASFFLLIILGPRFMNLFGFLICCLFSTCFWEFVTYLLLLIFFFILLLCLFLPLFLFHFHFHFHFLSVEIPIYFQLLQLLIFVCFLIILSIYFQ